MERVLAACCIYDDDSWLPTMVEGIYTAVDEILFLVSSRPWNGQPSELDLTCSAIESLPDPERKITVLRGSWGSETEQRNVGLEYARASGAELVMIIDADEIYDPSQVLLMRRAMTQHPQVGAWYVSMFTYWHSIEYRVDPPEQFQPVVFVRPSIAQFVENRHVRSETTALFPPKLAICHHLSYARTDEQVAKKLSRFSHSHEIQPGWYESVWLQWTPESDMRDFHPVYPGAYHQAVRQDPALYPPALRRALAEGKLR